MCDDWHGNYLVFDSLLSSQYYKWQHEYHDITYLSDSCIYIKSASFCDFKDIQYAIPLNQQRFSKILKMHNFFTEKFQILK